MSPRALPRSDDGFFARRARRRATRRALRAELRARVAALEANPTVKAARARALARRRRRQLVALIIVLLLLLLRFDCPGGPGGPPPVVEATPPVKETPTLRRPTPKKPPLAATIEESPRDTLVVDPLEPPAWLPQFRLQAAARSPKLAACFNGAEKPGALRWSALVHAQSGRVTDSVVEPVFRGIPLDDAAHDCLVQGLSEPPFRLDEPDPDAAPRRVSLIFEF